MSIGRQILLFNYGYLYGSYTNYNQTKGKESWALPRGHVPRPKVEKKTYLPTQNCQLSLIDPTQTDNMAAKNLPLYIKGVSLHIASNYWLVWLDLAKAMHCITGIPYSWRQIYKSFSQKFVIEPTPEIHCELVVTVNLNFMLSLEVFSYRELTDWITVVCARKVLLNHFYNFIHLSMADQ